jgi:hypothetical protein
MIATLFSSSKCCNWIIFGYYQITDSFFSDLNNTINVPNPLFGLVANTQAAPGMGTVTDANCLQVSASEVLDVSLALIFLSSPSLTMRSPMQKHPTTSVVWWLHLSTEH